jgi:F-type H+-transporting ATPase subunit epsilon
VSPDAPGRLHLRVVTPRRVLVDAEAEEVQLPGLEGLLGILPGHRPLLVALGRGTISYRKGSGGEAFEVRGGQARVLPDRVQVFT